MAIRHFGTRTSRLCCIDNEATDIPMRHCGADSPSIVSVLRFMQLLDLTNHTHRYSNAAIASKNLQELSERATRALTDWERNLPESLRLDKTASGTVPPQVLVLQ